MKNKSIIATVGAVGITTLLILFQVNTVGAAPAAAKPAPSTNRLARLLTGKEPPRLSVAQAEAFAQQNGRRPEALLAAYQASTEKAFLREAMEKYPRDARVALAAACIGGSDKNNGEVAQARRTWLDTFQRVAPTNALADYLSAREHFKTGQADLAVKEALAAAGKPVGDYALDWIQNTEEAYRSIGYPDAEARVIAMVTLLMPHLGQLRDLGKELVLKANIDRNNGDAASAQKLLQTAANLGARLDGPGTPTLNRDAHESLNQRRGAGAIQTRAKIRGRL